MKRSGKKGSVAFVIWKTNASGGNAHYMEQRHPDRDASHRHAMTKFDCAFLKLDGCHQSSILSCSNMTELQDSTYIRP